MKSSIPQSDVHRQPTGDGCDTLFSPDYGEIYHSRYGALTESEHVFLDGTGVKQRCRGDAEPVKILEVGFGAGLNFLVTARYCRSVGGRLHYVALEKTLLSAQVLAGLNHSDRLPEAAAIRQTLLAWRQSLPEPLPDRLTPCCFGDDIRLEIVPGDARTIRIPGHGYHAIYHDPFSPKVNPALWQRDFFARLYAVLAPGGRLSTYSVNGAVRRSLQAVGFVVEKRPGPPGKREVLAAIKPGLQEIG